MFRYCQAVRPPAEQKCREKTKRMKKIEKTFLEKRKIYF